MNSHFSSQKQIKIIETYFRKVDARDSTLLDLFTDDVQMFFPKFGLGYGKADLIKFSEIMNRHLESLEHDIDSFHYIVSDNCVVVEGTERGVTRDGVCWPDGLVSQGRFCNVFEFKGALIHRMFIYVDPDYTSSDRDRVDIFHPVEDRS
jgi:hypothetical protein